MVRTAACLNISGEEARLDKKKKRWNVLSEQRARLVRLESTTEVQKDDKMNVLQTKKLTNIKYYHRDKFKEELSLLLGNSCVIIVL